MVGNNAILVLLEGGVNCSGNASKERFAYDPPFSQRTGDELLGAF